MPGDSPFFSDSPEDTKTLREKIRDGKQFYEDLRLRTSYKKVI